MFLVSRLVGIIFAFDARGVRFFAQDWLHLCVKPSVVWWWVAVLGALLMLFGDRATSSVRLVTVAVAGLVFLTWGYEQPWDWLSLSALLETALLWLLYAVFFDTLIAKPLLPVLVFLALLLSLLWPFFAISVFFDDPFLSPFRYSAYIDASLYTTLGVWALYMGWQNRHASAPSLLHSWIIACCTVAGAAFLFLFGSLPVTHIALLCAAGRLTMLIVRRVPVSNVVDISFATGVGSAMAALAAPLPYRHYALLFLPPTAVTWRLFVAKNRGVKRYLDTIVTATVWLAMALCVAYAAAYGSPASVCPPSIHSVTLVSPDFSWTLPSSYGLRDGVHYEVHLHGRAMMNIGRSVAWVEKSGGGGGGGGGDLQTGLTFADDKTANTTLRFKDVADTSMQYYPCLILDDGDACCTSDRCVLHVEKFHDQRLLELRAFPFSNNSGEVVPGARLIEVCPYASAVLSLVESSHFLVCLMGGSPDRLSVSSVRIAALSSSERTVGTLDRSISFIAQLRAPRSPTLRKICGNFTRWERNGTTPLPWNVHPEVSVILEEEWHKGTLEQWVMRSVTLRVKGDDIFYDPGDTKSYVKETVKEGLVMLGVTLIMNTFLLQDSVYTRDRWQRFELAASLNVGDHPHRSQLETVNAFLMHQHSTTWWE